MESAAAIHCPLKEFVRVSFGIGRSRSLKKSVLNCLRSSSKEGEVRAAPMSVCKGAAFLISVAGNQLFPDGYGIAIRGVGFELLFVPKGNSCQSDQP